MHTLLAMSPALRTTLVYAFIWGVAFPGFVTGLIIYAIVQARGESQADKAMRHRRDER